MARSSTTASPSNQLAVRHAAKSPAIVEVNTPPVVRELMDAMSEQVAFLTPADALIVERLARIVVRLRLIDEYLDRLGGGLIDARGRPRGCWKLYSSLEHQFRETCKLLGLGPAVRAQLMQAMAGAGRDTMGVQAAQERLRAKVKAASEGAA